MQKQHDCVRECQVDTDVEMLIPDEYVRNIDGIFARVRDGGVVIDVKSAMTRYKPPRGIRLWSL